MRENFSPVFPLPYSPMPDDRDNTSQIYTPEEQGYVEVPGGPKCGTCTKFRAPNVCMLPLSIPVSASSGCCNSYKENKNATRILVSEIKRIREDHYMGRNIDPNLANQIFRRYTDLKNRGIPEPEIQRAIMSEYAYGSHFSDPWPPKPSGIDYAGAIVPSEIPSSKYPPYEGITSDHKLTGMDSDLAIPSKLAVDEEVSIPGSLSTVSIGAKKEAPHSNNWIATGATTIGPPAMHGEEPAFNKRQMPEESWYPWKMKEAYVPAYGRYIYNGHEAGSEFCKTFHRMVFDLNTKENRPVLPSENVGFTTQHPNCQCTWEMLDPILAANIEPDFLLGHQKDHITSINRLVGQKARYGTLHPLNSDGSVSDARVNVNPRKLLETIGSLKEEFSWLSPTYLDKIGDMQRNIPGKLYLVRAAAEAETDHRMEGEPYKRKLGGMELVKTARTGIGKKVDINHNPAWLTDSIVMDGEGDELRNEIQFLVLVKDSEISAAIDNGTIGAVSINAGVPRENIIAPCEHSCDSNSCELCSHPVGLVLGELDGIAFTWVVTNPDGFMWKGNWIPPAEPGVKTTKIESL